MNNNKYSNYKIVWFPEKLQSLKNGTVKAPLYVRMKPTNKCCHHCFYCVYKPKFSGLADTIQPNDELKLEKVIEILHDFKEMGVKAVTYSGGGEPLMHPNIYEMLKVTSNNGIDLSIISNGQLLKGDTAELIKEKSKWIRISADYYDQDSFIKSRGTEGMYTQIVKNLIAFGIPRKRKCDYGINFIITKDNHTHILQAAKFFKDMGTDNIRFSPMWLPTFYEYHLPLMDTVKQQLTLARQTLQDTNFSIYDSYNIAPDTNKRYYTTCYFMQVNPVVGADGNVYACHNKAYMEDGMIGTVNNKTFKELWSSASTKEFFEKFNAQVCCLHQCTNDKKNLIIENLINCEGDNFV